MDELLVRLKQLKLLKARGQQRTDSTHILGAVRQLNRIEIVGETMRQALNKLSELAPEWVQEIARPEWFTRYGRRFEQMRLPKERTEREALLETIGQDGMFLLEAVRTAPGAERLRELPEVEFLRRMWVQQYWTEGQEDGSQSVHLRTDDNQPPGALRLHSPYDEDVRYSAKGEQGWVGYKIQLSETCGKEEVHLITQVTTTLATEADMTTLENVHRSLQQKDLLPDCRDQSPSAIRLVATSTQSQIQNLRLRKTSPIAFFAGASLGSSLISPTGSKVERSRANSPFTPTTRK